MKKRIILSLLIASFLFCKSQSKDELPYFKDNIFYTKIESGIGEKVLARFKISAETIIKIRATKVYLRWEKETYSNPENEEYVKTYKSMSHIEVFLMDNIMISSRRVQARMKNETSYGFVKGGFGNVEVDDKEKIYITYPFQSQNGYGNIVISTACYSLSWDEENNQIKPFIYIMD